MRIRSRPATWWHAVAALVLAGCASSPDPGPTGGSARNVPPADPPAVAAASAPMPRPAVPAPVVGRADRTTRARDAYVLLSGGGTPLSNHYSQYLQAKAIAAFFERECPP